MLLPAVIEAKIQQILQPLTVPVPRPVTQAPLSVKPKLNFSTHPSAKQSLSSLPPNQPETLAWQRNYGSESNLLDALSSATDDAGVSGDGGNWSRSGMRTAGSVPDLLSPRADHSDEPPPLPPERPVASAEKPDAANGAQQRYYDSPSIGDSFYNTPPVKYPHQSDAAEFYNVPPTTYLAERDSSVNDACYDVPPTDDETNKQSVKKARKKQSAAEICKVMGGDVYNVPPVHNADDSWTSAGSGGKRSREGRDVRTTGSSDNQKSSVCLADQTYDFPSAEQWDGKLQRHDAASSASMTDETYDTPSRHEIGKNKIRQQKPADKQPVDFRPSAIVSDQMYDTPLTSESFAKTPPNKPHRGKPRSSLETSEALRHSEQLAGQETYDTPPTVQNPPATVKPTVAVRGHQQSAVPTNEMYDVPPLMSVAGRSSNRISLSGAADLMGLSRPSVAEEQTYNVPASCVPPVPAKRNPAPPPKPPRPRVSLPGHGLVSTTDTSVSPAQQPAKAVHDVSENELTERDTVAELPSAGMKGTCDV